MSILPVANGQIPNADEPAPGPTGEKPLRPKRKGRNFAQIHAKPLPLEIYPLPAFHPTNPISLLKLAYTWITHILFPATSHPEEQYQGYFSPETRSVHITDPKHARALWEMGFFGKGTLSRSEPSWLEREKAKVRKELFGGGGRSAAEDATNARREERRLFKLERARVERERIERQRSVEEGKLDGDVAEDLGDGSVTMHEITSGPTRVDLDDAVLSENENVSTLAQNGSIDGSTTVEVGSNDTDAPPIENSNWGVHTKVPDANRVPDANLLPVDRLTIETQSNALQPSQLPEMNAFADDEDLESIPNQEHLQLTLEEAFFLTYGLGVLSIYPTPASSDSDSPPVSPLSVKSYPDPYSTSSLMELFNAHSTFPPSPPDQGIAPDDQFLLNYVTYHHFRSLGWVVRPGLKFGVDYLLYNRGPVFSHAEFAVIILPAYSQRYWNTPGGRGRRRVWEQKDWWWLHCVSRVQSQVKKTLVLCYVEVPSPLDWDWDFEEGEEVKVGRLLKSYRVREFVVRRWLANRSRD